MEHTCEQKILFGVTDHRCDVPDEVILADTRLQVDLSRNLAKLDNLLVTRTTDQIDLKNDIRPQNLPKNRSLRYLETSAFSCSNRSS